MASFATFSIFSRCVARAASLRSGRRSGSPQRSNTVRARVVHGIPSTTVTWSASSNDVEWKRLRVVSWSRPRRPVTSITLVSR